MVKFPLLFTLIFSEILDYACNQASVIDFSSSKLFLLREQASLSVYIETYSLVSVFFLQ